MPYVFKNRDLGEWVYKFFDEPSVQKQIETQWADAVDYILLTTFGTCPCETHDEFDNTRVSLLIDKKDLLPRMEYRPEQWNPCPQVTPPKEGWYLITVQLPEGEAKTEVDWYYSAVDCWEDNASQHVLAFKPLPVPYKPEKSE